jgi:hypothetical protein
VNSNGTAVDGLLLRNGVAFTFASFFSNAGVPGSGPSAKYKLTLDPLSSVGTSHKKWAWVPVVAKRVTRQANKNLIGNRMILRIALGWLKSVMQRKLACATFKREDNILMDFCNDV